MRVVRVCRASWRPTDPTAFANRWNAAGERVLYCADHFGTALLEQLAHMKGAPPFPSHAAWAEWPNAVRVEKRTIADLPAGWDDLNDVTVAQQVGSDWYTRGATVALIVPSVPGRPFERNVVLNTTHADWARVVWEDPVRVPWDRRLYLAGDET